LGLCAAKVYMYYVFVLRVACGYVIGDAWGCWRAFERSSYLVTSGMEHLSTRVVSKHV
jgi:hypothetical protein